MIAVVAGALLLMLLGAVIAYIVFRVIVSRRKEQTS